MLESWEQTVDRLRLATALVFAASATVILVGHSSGNSELGVVGALGVFFGSLSAMALCIESLIRRRFEWTRKPWQFTLLGMLWTMAVVSIVLALSRVDGVLAVAVLFSSIVLSAAVKEVIATRTGRRS